MRQSGLRAVIFCAFAGACRANQPANSESVPASSLAPVQSAEEAHDEIVHLEPVVLSEVQEPVSTTSPLGEVVSADREQLLGCWATSRGLVTLSLELDMAGQVVGGSTDPGGGQEGLAAVADCVLARARGWRFPASGGGTRVLIAPLLVPDV